MKNKVNLLLEIGKTIVKRGFGEKAPFGPVGFRENADVDAETNNFIISKIFSKM